MPKKIGPIRDRFKKERKLKGTQDYVGVENGVTGTTIRYIENGYTVPSGKLILRLSSYFAVPVEDLFPDVMASSELSEEPAVPSED